MATDSDPGPAPDYPEYDLADDPPPARPLPVAGNVPGTPAAAVASLPVVGYQTAPRAAAPVEDLYFPSRFRDLYLPAALLLFGLALGFGGLVHLSGQKITEAFAFGSAYAVVKFVILLVAIPLLTRLAGVSFGTLPAAALKLSAIALLPEAVGLLIFIAGGWCFGLIVALVVTPLATWALFALLFEVEPSEAAFCAAVYWAIGLVFAVGWLTLLDWMLGWV